MAFFEQLALNAVGALLFRASTYTRSSNLTDASKEGPRLDSLSAAVRARQHVLGDNLMDYDRVDLSACAVRSRLAWGLDQFLVLALEKNEFNPDVRLEDMSLK
ncbi:hypothetical protein B0H19DRAFT_1274743 [Mycena capillaripes]|nr:hypothetical protein B0H19DRAFT_1274743 [Mycena capillaripes]